MAEFFINVDKTHECKKGIAYSEFNYEVIPKNQQVMRSRTRYIKRY